MTSTLTILLIIAGLLFALLGIIGCILPVIPGPVFSFISLLMLSYSKDWQVFSQTFLIVMGVLTVMLGMVDYVLPLLGAKTYNASKYGLWGSVLGMLAGIFFFPPWGLFLGAFAGAIGGEIIAGKDGKKALRVGWGIFLGNMAVLIFKLSFCGAALFFYVKKIL